MVSGLITLALLLLFVGGWIWAWSPRRKRSFDEAARLPLDDGEGAARQAAAPPAEAGEGQQGSNNEGGAGTAAGKDPGERQ